MNNTAAGDGGVMYTNASSHMISGSIFSRNSAGGDGGATFIRMANSQARVEKSMFSHNNVTDQGRAYYVSSSALMIHGTNFMEIPTTLVGL